MNTLAIDIQLTRGDFQLKVNCSLPASGITAIFGRSGCGKTSLLRAIAGLESGVTGTISFDQQHWLQPELNVPTHQRGIGYVFQEPGLFPHLSVKQNLEYGLKRATDRQQVFEFDQVVNWLGIESWLDKRPQSLSGGQRQRVAIGRALLSQPQLLLMDEPLSALDASSKREILPYLERLHSELNIPILYVSHSTDEVARLADHLLLMHQGEVVAQDTINSMLTRLDLPLAHSENAEAIIEATVSGVDGEYGLMQLAGSGGELSVACQSVDIGRQVRLRLLARDISVTLKRQTDSSILNVLPVEIDAIQQSDSTATQLLLRLRWGKDIVLARVTRKSVDALGLSVGQQIYAQVKSVAVLA
ncbi:molybdenum ABC transporter ATP-binding protein [Maricurvus nonylphenolicus]|uniref:molybdenum ABC transporter ATP-binding protein n=1 Tax=Maricurvus nonylphenolicus TaxID=1008307 RepID=UPI0036F3EF9C